jgi:hypothetical protein
VRLPLLDGERYDFKNVIGSQSVLIFFVIFLVYTHFAFGSHHHGYPRLLTPQRVMRFPIKADLRLKAYLRQQARRNSTPDSATIAHHVCHRG